MLKKASALLLVAALLTTGCASASAGRSGAQIAPAIEQTAMAEYAQRIPAGSRVRVERTTGEMIRGTLMKATAETVTIQKNTRIPEAPVEIPLASIARLTLDQGGGSSTAKAIGIGIASGVGAFFAIIAVIAAAWND